MNLLLPAILCMLVTGVCAQDRSKAKAYEALNQKRPRTGIAVSYAPPKRSVANTTDTTPLDIIVEKKETTTETMVAQKEVDAMARRREMELDAEHQAQLRQDQKDAFDERSRQLEARQQELRDRIEANRSAVQRRENGDGNWDRVRR